MSHVIRAYDASVDSIDKADRSLVARINTAGVDRYHTVIDPRGGNLANYIRNPVVLWEHGKDVRHGTDPIGKNVWIRHNGGKHPTELLARTKFLEDEFSQQRFEWYRDGTLNAFSVNILPVASASGPPTPAEVRAAPEWEAAETIYREWELAEYSGTTVPGNADCLVVERALKFKLLADREKIWLPDEVAALVAARTMAESGGMASGGAVVIPRYIRHEGGKWKVYSESGEVLGTHDSESDAKAQLAAIEAHKHGDRTVPAIEGRPLLEIARSLAEERRAMQQALRDEVIATINLLVYGRV